MGDSAGRFGVFVIEPPGVFDDAVIYASSPELDDDSLGRPDCTLKLSPVPLIDPTLEVGLSGISFACFRPFRELMSFAEPELVDGLRFRVSVNKSNFP